MHIILVSYICHTTFLAIWTQFQVNSYIKFIGENQKKKKEKKHVSPPAGFQNGKPNNIVWHSVEYKIMYEA